MRVEPIPFDAPHPATRMLGQAADEGGPAAWATATDRALDQYPDFFNGYILRLGRLCEGSDLQAILADLNSALKYGSSSPLGQDSQGSLLSMRAKIEFANGDESASIEDMDRAIHAGLADPTQIVNSGPVASESSSSVCGWTVPSVDAVVQRFPNDYRSHLFRGIYYGSFTILDEESLGPAIGNLRRAAEMNGGSPLPHLFIADIRDKAFYFKRMNMSDAQRQEFDRDLLSELSAALAIDPNLLPALIKRANVYYGLNQFQRAMTDYNQILTLDPTNAAAYNDRGLAKTALGDPYGAISDFGMAISRKKRKLEFFSSHEHRAGAYAKTQQWERAISDLTTAISLGVPLIRWSGSIKQFRALYPEYATASDEAVARKLNQTFHPESPADLLQEEFLSGEKTWGSTVMPDLYMKRSDAYLKAGDWLQAAVEYRRTISGFPDSESWIDRWREVDSTQDSRLYIDMKTLEDSENDSVRLWVKETAGPSDAGPYSLQQFELKCSERQIRTASLANYSDSGSVTGTREGGNWASVIPDTLGETLLHGMCRDGR